MTALASRMERIPCRRLAILGLFAMAHGAGFRVLRVFVVAGRATDLLLLDVNVVGEGDGGHLSALQPDGNRLLGMLGRLRGRQQAKDRQQARKEDLRPIGIS